MQLGNNFVPVRPKAWISRRARCKLTVVTSTAGNERADESRELGPWERWGTDWNGEPIIEWDHEAHDAWCERWCPSCPDHKPQCVRRALGFRERNERELELRVPLGGTDDGVCTVAVDEREHEIYVRVVLHYDESRFDDPREYVVWPVRVWLERPLGDRAVIDEDSDEELELFTVSWDNKTHEPLPDHGFSKANRRRPTAERPPRDADSFPVWHQ